MEGACIFEFPIVRITSCRPEGRRFLRKTRRSRRSVGARGEILDPDVALGSGVLTKSDTNLRRDGNRQVRRFVRMVARVVPVIVTDVVGIDIVMRMTVVTTGCDLNVR